MMKTISRIPYSAPDASKEWISFDTLLCDSLEDSTSENVGYEDWVI